MLLNCISFPHFLNNIGLKNSLFQHFTQLRPLSYIAKCNITNYNYYLFCLKHRTLYIPKTLWQKLRIYIFTYRSFASNPHGGHQNPFNAAYLFPYFQLAIPLGPGTLPLAMCLILSKVKKANYTSCIVFVKNFLQFLHCSKHNIKLL